MDIKTKLTTIRSFCSVAKESNDESPKPKDLSNQLAEANKAIENINPESLEDSVKEGQNAMENLSKAPLVVNESREGKITFIRTLPKSVTESYHVHPLMICMGDKEKERKLLVKNKEITKKGLEAFIKHLS